MYHFSSTADGECCTAAAAAARSFQCHSKKPDQAQNRVRLHKTTTTLDDNDDESQQSPATGPYRFVVLDKQQRRAATKGNNFNQTAGGELATRHSYAQSYRRKSLCTFAATDVHQAILTNNIVPSNSRCCMSRYDRSWSSQRRRSGGAVVDYDDGIGNAAICSVGNRNRERHSIGIGNSNVDSNGHLSDTTNGLCIAAATAAAAAAISINSDDGQAGEEVRLPLEGQLSAHHKEQRAKQAKRYPSSHNKLCTNQLSRSAVAAGGNVVVVVGRSGASSSYTDQENNYDGNAKLSSQEASRGWRMGWNMEQACCAAVKVPQSYVVSDLKATGTSDTNIETTPKLSSEAESDSGRSDGNCFRRNETAALSVKNHHQSSLSPPPPPPPSLRPNSKQLSSSSPSLPKLLDRIGVWRSKGNSNDPLSHSSRAAAAIGYELTATTTPYPREHNSPPNSSLTDAVRHKGAPAKPINISSPNIARKSNDHLDHKHDDQGPNHYHPKYNNKSRAADKNKLIDRMHSVHSLSMQLDQASIRQMHCDPSDLAGVASLAAHSAPQSPTISQSVLNSLNGEQLALNQSAANKIGRIVGKKASRLKEIVLQNLGRADKTTDELFELYEESFFKQHNKTSKLSKEFKNYMNALKGFHDARRSLNKCIQNATSDYQSARHDLVCENLSQLEQLNDDLVEKLREQVAGRLNEYMTQFNVLKEKVSKRRRKMIDYDSSRRAYEIFMNDINKKRQRQQQQQQQQQQGANSKRNDSANSINGSSFNLTNQLFDEARLLKLREQFNYCKIMYESINGELHEELPLVYEKRMKHLLMALQSYFALEAHFHSNASKLLGTASDVIDELPTLPIASANIQQVSNNNGKSGSESKSSSSSAKCANSDYDGCRDDSQYTDPSCSTIVVSPPNVANCGGSSGVGSSRGESSIDSASDSGSGTPTCGSGPVDSTGDKDAVDHNEQDSSSSSDEEEQPAEGDATGKDDAPSQGTDGIAAAPQSGIGSAAQDTCADEHTICLPDAADIVANDDSKAAQEESGAEIIVSDAIGQEIEESKEFDEIDQESLFNEVKSKVVGEIKAVLSKAEKKQTLEAPGALSASPKDMTLEKDERSCSTVATDETAVVATGDGKDEKAKDSDAKILYKVKSNYKYLAEDVDELCFEPEEIIQVIEFDSEHEPEEGWLMGIRECNGQRGLFPANFTQPI